MVTRCSGGFLKAPSGGGGALALYRRFKSMGHATKWRWALMEIWGMLEPQPYTNWMSPKPQGTMKCLSSEEHVL